MTATPTTQPASGQSQAAVRHQQLMQVTQKWVGQTFFGTLLKQVRESPFKSEVFDGGRGGQAFGSLYDQQLADRISRGAGTKLVKSIVRRIEGAAAYRTQSALAAQAHKTPPAK